MYSANYNPFTIEGKTILITGASSGIGAITAIECSKMGAHLIICGRNKERLQKTYNLLEGEGHQQYIIDLTEHEQLTLMIEQIPLLDGIVSNAGISKVLPIQFFNETDFNHIITTNTFAPIFLIQKLFKKKKIKKGGSIVFTASISGIKMVSIGGGMYSVSKSALDAFMRSAALEFAAKGIRVNSVNPSRVNTNLIKNNDSFSKEDLAKDMLTYPLRRYAEPEEIANAIIFLLSDASSYITGHALIVDGGKTLT